MVNPKSETYKGVLIKFAKPANYGSGSTKSKVIYATFRGMLAQGKTKAEALKNAKKKINQRLK